MPAVFLFVQNEKSLRTQNCPFTRWICLWFSFHSLGRREIMYRLQRRHNSSKVEISKGEWNACSSYRDIYLTPTCQIDLQNHHVSSSSSATPRKCQQLIVQNSNQYDDSNASRLLCISLHMCSLDCSPSSRFLPLRTCSHSPTLTCCMSKVAMSTEKSLISPSKSLLPPTNHDSCSLLS